MNSRLGMLCALVCALALMSSAAFSPGAARAQSPAAMTVVPCDFGSLDCHINQADAFVTTSEAFVCVPTTTICTSDLNCSLTDCAEAVAEAATALLRCETLVGATTCEPATEICAGECADLVLEIADEIVGCGSSRAACGETEIRALIGRALTAAGCDESIPPRACAFPGAPCDTVEECSNEVFDVVSCEPQPCETARLVLALVFAFVGLAEEEADGMLFDEDGDPAVDDETIVMPYAAALLQQEQGAVPPPGDGVGLFTSWYAESPVPDSQLQREYPDGHCGAVGPKVTHYYDPEESPGHYYGAGMHVACAGLTSVSCYVELWRTHGLVWEASDSDEDSTSAVCGLWGTRYKRRWKHFAKAHIRLVENRGEWKYDAGAQAEALLGWKCTGWGTIVLDCERKSKQVH